MCGICSIIGDESEAQVAFAKLERNIKRRGPDSFNTKTVKSNADLFFAASVLWLQGENPTEQPLENDDYIFLYNGDIYGDHSEPDTHLFLDRFKENQHDFLYNNYGPYAFILYDKNKKKITFGRDKFGRKSLLLGKEGDALIITSVSVWHHNSDFIELPAIGTFSYDLITGNFTLTQWPVLRSNFNIKIEELQTFLKKPITISHENLVHQQPIIYREPTVDDLSVYQNFTTFGELLGNAEYFEKILTLENYLKESVKRRVLKQPKYCKNCIKTLEQCTHATTGILFSGGIDCSILALIADEFVDKNRPIDLINVAFENKHSLCGYGTPDRQTSEKTLRELRNLRPEREWNLVEINISCNELRRERKEQIADLLHPTHSPMDDSLGCALWFAARGHNGDNDYSSPCRVLLVGMGADELFGGYHHHRVGLSKNGFQQLHNSLEQDWENLPDRNLGRDDRVISDHGRQMRTPYLDEDLVNFVRKLNCWERTYPVNELPQGIGEKIMLRTLGHYLGLQNAARFPKRALQFGSRIVHPKEIPSHVNANALFKLTRSVYNKFLK